MDYDYMYILFYASVANSWSVYTWQLCKYVMDKWKCMETVRKVSENICQQSFGKKGNNTAPQKQLID